MRRHPWLVVSVLGLLGVLTLGSFPVRAYVDQVDEREELARRAAAVHKANEQLVAKADQLSSDETIERLARERYHLVRPGEEAYAILPDGESAGAPVAAAAGAVVPEPATRGAGNWWSRVWGAITSLL